MDEGGSGGGKADIFTAVSYNVHRCRGIDARRKPERIAHVIRELAAPVVGLQEVDSLDSVRSQSRYLAQATGLMAIDGPAIKSAGGYYGNVLLTSYEVIESGCLDISIPGWEPRCAIDAVLNIQGHRVRVIVTHLGLTSFQRRRQVKRLMKMIEERSDELVILLGDMNEWLPGTPRIRKMHRLMGKAPAPGTFPSFLPAIPLDRIWVKPRSALKLARTHTSRMARIASDHLPVVAYITVPPQFERAENETGNDYFHHRPF